MTSSALLRVPEDRAFLSVDRAKKMLSEARSLLEAKKVKDVAEAMRVWARAQKEGQAAKLDAEEIALRAAYRLGELSAEVNRGVGPGRGKKGQQSSSTFSKAIGELGLSETRAREYEKIASIPKDAFEDLISSSRSEGKEITTASALRLASGGRPNAAFSSESVEWYTPEKYIEAARATLGTIDLDPATSAAANATVRAKKIFLEKENGLSHPWHGRVWLNPPYGEDESSGESNCAVWSQKLISEHRCRHTTAAILLVNAVTERKWFRPLFSYPICFTDHRIEFYTPSGQPRSPVSGNAFVYFGSDVERFADQFSTFGSIVVPFNHK